jgi:hypothetical protein
MKELQPRKLVQTQEGMMHLKVDPASLRLELRVGEHSVTENGSVNDMYLTMWLFRTYM